MIHIKVLVVKNKTIQDEIKKKYPDAEYVTVNSLKDFEHFVGNANYNYVRISGANSYKVHVSADLDSKTIAWCAKGEVLAVEYVTGKFLKLAKGGFIYNNPKYVTYPYRG